MCLKILTGWKKASGCYIFRRTFGDTVRNRGLVIFTYTTIAPFIHYTYCLDAGQVVIEGSLNTAMQALDKSACKAGYYLL